MRSYVWVVAIVAGLVLGLGGAVAPAMADACNDAIARFNDGRFQRLKAITARTAEALGGDAAAHCKSARGMLEDHRAALKQFRETERQCGARLKAECDNSCWAKESQEAEDYVKRACAPPPPPQPYKAQEPNESCIRLAVLALSRMDDPPDEADIAACSKADRISCEAAVNSFNHVGRQMPAGLKCR